MLALDLLDGPNAPEPWAPTRPRLPLLRHGRSAGLTATADEGSAPGWAAQRALEQRPEWAEDADPLLLTGEMMYPWMFEDIAALHPFRGAAQILMAGSDWPPLWDVERLAANEVPVAAAVYFDDAYVDVGLSLQTARAVPQVRTWVTNEWEHHGLQDEVVLARLMDMVAGKV